MDWGNASLSVVDVLWINYMCSLYECVCNGWIARLWVSLGCVEQALVDPFWLTHLCMPLLNICHFSSLSAPATFSSSTSPHLKMLFWHTELIPSHMQTYDIASWWHSIEDLTSGRVVWVTRYQWLEKAMIRAQNHVSSKMFTDAVTKYAPPALHHKLW